MVGGFVWMGKGEKWREIRFGNYGIFWVRTPQEVERVGDILVYIKEISK